MRPTRRFWTVAGVGVALAGWGLVTAAPSLVVGAGAVGAWLVLAQFSFLLALGDAVSGLSVTLSVDEERVTARETAAVTLAASRAAGSPSLRVTAASPVGVEGTVPPLALDASTEAETTADLRWPVAGEFDFATPEVTFLDRFGLFAATVPRGESPTVVVEPRAPRTVHVGAGGEEAITGFGEHETGQTGSGLRPAEVREYLPGDSVRNIDWKATARLAEAHVREFEVETDRETKLFLDHRGSMGDGPEGETKLDYARQLALAVLASARTYGDPVGCYTVGDEGTTASYDPGTRDEHANAIRRELLTLAPTLSGQSGPGVFSPALARRRERALAEERTALATTLRPYYADTTRYVRRVESRPLFDAVTTFGSAGRGTAVSVLVTDDSHRAEVREAVRLARQVDAGVAVYLTPTVLFADSALDDLDAAYDRYVEFESFRHDLDAMAGVSAFEVGPADRLTAVLGARRADRGVHA